jgi:hypothetical protein
VRRGVRRTGLVWAVAGLAAGAWGCPRRGPTEPTPAPSVAPAQLAETPDAEMVALPEPDPPDEGVRPDAAPETVTIKLVADQRKQAHVFWGRKELGVAPLEVTRPRGSGPLDLLVLADGYLPLHTRAFTDRNETLVLRLHAAAEASALPGYSPPVVKDATKPPSRGTADNPGRKPSGMTPGFSR